MDLACAVSLFEENALTAGRYVDTARGIEHAAAVEVVDGRGSLLAVNGRGGGDARIYHFYNFVSVPRHYIVCLLRAFRNINDGEA